MDDHRHALVSQKETKVKSKPKNSHSFSPPDDNKQPSQTGGKHAASGKNPKHLSNWAQLKLNLRDKNLRNPSRQKLKRPPQPQMSVGGETSVVHTKLTRILALDCEMVGAGKTGDRSLLARVTVLNATGAVVYDSYVAPTEPVTDMRTKWSGIRAANLKNAPSFEDVKRHVSSLLQGRIIVGHALSNDLKALGLDHPEGDMRDTSQYIPLRRVLPSGRTKPQALKLLAEKHLQMSIQVGEHDPIEDARAALSLYQKYSAEWERSLLKRPSGLEKKRKSISGIETKQGMAITASKKKDMINCKRPRILTKFDLEKLTEKDVMVDF